MTINGYKRVMSSTGQLKAAFVIIIVAFILQCVGLSTSYWVRISTTPGFEVRVGLWNHCACFSGTSVYGTNKDTNCFCTSWSESIIDGWLTAVRTLEVVGLISAFFLGVILFAQIACTKNTSIKLWGILLALAAGLCILTGVTVYGIRQMQLLHFSFWCCAISGVMCLLTTFLLVVDRKLAHKICERSQSGHVISNPGRVIGYPGQQTTTECPPNYEHAQFGPPPSYTTLPRPGSDIQTTVTMLPPPYSEFVQDKT